MNIRYVVLALILCVLGFALWSHFKSNTGECLSVRSQGAKAALGYVEHRLRVDEFFYDHVFGRPKSSSEDNAIRVVGIDIFYAGGVSTVFGADMELSGSDRKYVTADFDAECAVSLSFPNIEQIGQQPLNGQHQKVDGQWIRRPRDSR